jgi:hypothetical protein
MAVYEPLYDIAIANRSGEMSQMKLDNLAVKFTKCGLPVKKM